MTTRLARRLRLLALRALHRTTPAATHRPAQPCGNRPCGTRFLA